MENIVIYVEGGVVQDVDIPEDCPCNVIVRDYDIEGSDQSILQEDQYGELYVESVFDIKTVKVSELAKKLHKE